MIDSNDTWHNNTHTGVIRSGCKRVAIRMKSYRVHISDMTFETLNALTGTNVPYQCMLIGTLNMLCNMILIQYFTLTPLINKFATSFATSTANTAAVWPWKFCIIWPKYAEMIYDLCYNQQPTAFNILKLSQRISWFSGYDWLTQMAQLESPLAVSTWNQIGYDIRIWVYQIIRSKKCTSWHIWCVCRDGSLFL